MCCPLRVKNSFIFSPVLKKVLPQSPNTLISSSAANIVVKRECINNMQKYLQILQGEKHNWIGTAFAFS